MNNSEGKTLDNKCPACSASLEFNAKLGKWKCDYCGMEYTLDELKKYENASNDKINDGVDGDDTSYDVYRCPDCGAEIVADEETASTFCVYCGNSAILKNKLSGKFAPNYIIPFKTTKDDAIETFKKLKKGRPLLPNDFVSPTNIEKIRGLYVPFWLYNILASGGISGTATKVTSWTSGDTHYTKTDTYHVSRDGKMSFSSIPVDGSTHFENDMMNSIEPFDYKDMIDYNHAYLSGFLSEKYDVDSEKAFEDAKTRALNSATSELKNSIVGYSSVSITQNNIATENYEHKYALLPVWMVNIKYKDKYYLFAMNGQTGKFIGNMPLSKKKALLYFIVLFVIIFFGFILLSYLAYKGGA